MRFYHVNSCGPPTSTFFVYPAFFKWLKTGFCAMFSSCTIEKVFAWWSKSRVSIILSPISPISLQHREYSLHQNCRNEIDETKIVYNWLLKYRGIIRYFPFSYENVWPTLDVPSYNLTSERFSKIIRNNRKSTLKKLYCLTYNKFLVNKNFAFGRFLLNLQQ